METNTTIDHLNEILDQLKQTFVGKDDIIDLMGICLVGRENLFLLGPPGTAKSAMVRELGRALSGRTFEYLLTRFTEPNEIFGPFDIRKLREGDLITNTEGMLPEAHLVFLDELLNANSAILNALLMVLNERIFRRGKETRDLPALMMVGASNHLPEDEALQALFDRFLIRVHCDNVDPGHLDAVLDAGWKLEKNRHGDRIQISPEEVAQLQAAIYQVDLSPIRKGYLELVEQLRNAGIPVSDRRAVKLQRLVAASALLCKREVAIPSDLWVMRYIWESEEQEEIIAGILDAAFDAEKEELNPHPRAFKTATPNADEIFKEIESLTRQWSDANTLLSEKAIIKDRLRHLSGRSQWISNEEQRKFVQQSIDKFWKTVLAENARN